MTFQGYYGQRLYLKGGYSGTDCRLRIYDATGTVLRSAYTTGFDVRLRSNRHVEVENLSFYELDEVVIDLNGGGYASATLEMVKIERTGGLTIDTTDAHSSRVEVWNTAVLRSYEAPAAHMILDDTELSMLYSTIYDNDRTSAWVGGLYLDTDGDSQLTISRSVLWDNGPVDLYVEDESISGNYVIVDGLERGNESYPIFMAYTSVDPRLDYDGAPLSNSPCIDAATATTSISRDLLGRARVRGSRSDIGAYEGPIN